jgi:hypothetical protein
VPELLSGEMHLDSLLFKGGFAIGNIVSIIFLVKNGSIIGTIYFKLIAVFIAAYAIGALLKLRHWPLADEIILFSISGVCITYLVRFLKKQSKTLPDILKLTWLLSASVLTYLLYIRWVDQVWVFIPTLVLWFAVVELIKRLKKDRNWNMYRNG